MKALVWIAVAIVALVDTAKPARADRTLLPLASHGEIDGAFSLSPATAAPYPCGKAVVREVWDFIIAGPEIRMTDDQLFLKIGGAKEVPAKEYSSADGTRIPDKSEPHDNPITGYWPRPNGETLAISIRRDYVTIARDVPKPYRLYTTAIAIIRNDGTPDRCRERWTGGSTLAAEWRAR